MSIASSETYLVDTHVHLYPDTDPGSVLSAAAGHMEQAAQGLGLPVRPPCMLMLTEVSGLDRFAGLQGLHGDWQITPTAEPVSLLARPADGGAPIAIISGRQIVTAEGLEVHALGTRRTFADGHPIREVLAEVLAGMTEDDVPEDGALAVLPWGVGKWSGPRGRIVAALIEETPPGLLLADSGVRPGFMARPALLATAEARGLRVIAGSDPLPLAGGALAAGRFGIIAGHAFDPDRPFAAFANWQNGLTTSPGTYGTLESPLGFLRAQITMQIRKRLKK